ncbi:glycosyltransferase family 4 protein [Serinicoccus kebangsaanensis]|uniref:glycosyltransferase family 4 protein n=1 Tax=Serinicoccus kebangsaanensis TaxID=2602069 RepID=UPI00178C1845|nr:glycosyltransferase family 4 protein [Serinicoccus kebangsaanensis]
MPGDLVGPSGGNRYNARVLAELAAMGVAVVEERIPGDWPRATEDDRRALDQALTRHGDVVVDGLIGSAAPAELASARARGVRVHVLVHLPLPVENGAGAREQARISASEHEALRVADTVVATSRWAREDLARRYDLRHVHAVPPGVDVAPVSRGSSPPHLLFVGALTRRKNPLALVDALAGVRDRSWTASLVGPAGADRAYVDAVRDAAAALRERVRVLGTRSDGELEAVWRTADLLVLPSTAETYGMVVSEALAHGVPGVVASGTGAVEALRGSGERDGLPDAGAVVDIDLPAAWGEALGRWLDHPDLRGRWRAAALDHRARLRRWGTAASEFRAVLGW